MSNSKVCFKCKKRKQLSSFYKHKMMADGHLGKCKECAKSDVTKNRNKRIDYYRKYDLERAKQPERVKAAAEITRLFRMKDSRIIACHNAVARAVRSGALTRKKCERCGSEKSLGHHESYDRKLDVTWLCQPCHKVRHKEMKKQGIDPLNNA